MEKEKTGTRTKYNKSDQVERPGGGEVTPQITNRIFSMLVISSRDTFFNVEIYYLYIFENQTYLNNKNYY